jgi:hypothetical protein
MERVGIIFTAVNCGVHLVVKKKLQPSRKNFLTRRNKMSCTQEQIDAVLFAHGAASVSAMPEVVHALEHAWPELWPPEIHEPVAEPEVDELDFDDAEDIA